jgi:hypothetical protein
MEMAFQMAYCSSSTAFRRALSGPSGGSSEKPKTGIFEIAHLFRQPPRRKPLAPCECASGPVLPKHRFAFAKAPESSSSIFVSH